MTPYVAENVHKNPFVKTQEPICAVNYHSFVHDLRYCIGILGIIFAYISVIPLQ